MTEGLLFSAASVATWAAMVMMFIFVRDAILVFGKNTTSKSQGSVVTTGGMAVALFIVGIAFTKPLVALALNDFKKNRAECIFCKDLQ